MEVLSKRATVYFDPEIHKAVKIKAMETARTLSEIVNDAVKQAIAEDAEDLAAFSQRAGDPLVGYEDAVKHLKRHGRL